MAAKINLGFASSQKNILGGSQDDKFFKGSVCLKRLRSYQWDKEC